MVITRWFLHSKMSTAIAYSFMTMDKRQRDSKPEVPRRSSNNSDKYSNAGYDNSSEHSTTRSGRRRPRKRSRSSSSSRTKKDNRVSRIVFFMLLIGTSRSIDGIV